jgi:dual specificity protein kinase YAK1
MDPWSDQHSGGERPRYTNTNNGPPTSDFVPNSQQPPAGFIFESYNQAPTNSQAIGNQALNAQSRSSDPHRDGDVKMEDADLYSRGPYSRTSQPSTTSATRPNLYSSIDESNPATRYSPMNPLSPGVYPMSPMSSYHTSPQPSPYSAYQGHRQSPTRQGSHQGGTPGFYAQQSGSPRVDQSGRASVKQEISSPDMSGYQPQFQQSYDQRQLPIRSAPPRETVMKFVRLKSMHDLVPQINQQPAFRRADPEGGFISPLQALTTNLSSTYRLCNPQFKYESSRNPRRVLTKPSKGTKNDGYDNEDSDYILYVNDILGSEEEGQK